MTSRVSGRACNGDQRLHPAVQRGQVDPGGVAGQHTALAQQPHPLQAGGRRDAHQTGQVPVGLPGIALQLGEYRRIDVVHKYSSRVKRPNLILIINQIVGILASFWR
jgi:hypothetical protein